MYGDLLYVRKDAPDRVVRYWRAGVFSPGKLARGWMPPHPTFYVRRSVYERLGGFNLSRVNSPSLAAGFFIYLSSRSF